MKVVIDKSPFKRLQRDLKSVIYHARVGILSP